MTLDMDGSESRAGWPMSRRKMPKYGPGLIPTALDVHRHPEAAAQRPSKDERPRPGRRPPISGLPEIGVIARKSATADLRWLASRAPQGDGNKSVHDAVYGTVPIVRSGILAREFCRHGARAGIAGVFDRSFYLRSGDMFICVGDPAIGNGPLTLIADASLRPSNLGLRPGQPASIVDRRIAIGDTIEFTLDRCEPWRPPPWPVCQSPSRLTDICAAVARAAAAEAPREGFGQLFCSHEQVTGRTPLASLARGPIARFEAWLSGAVRTDHALATAPAPIQGLIGLGPGLTPSGDDFLVGALALLDALTERKVHAALAAAIADVSPASTSAMSRCFLTAAAAGHIGEHLHCAVASVISGKIDSAIAAVRNIGHSSGWDMLAGIVTTLRIVASAAFRFEVPKMSLPQPVQELQIGGTSVRGIVTSG